MIKVTYFDVEYANSKNKSICQMGIMSENYEDGEPVYPELNLYINPEDGFDLICSQVHGISPEKVKNSPSFPEVWSSIEKYFTNSIIIGHNVAGADLDALIKSLKRYNIDIPEMYYVDTLDIAHENIPSCYVKDYRMSTLCNYFDIEIDNAHDAFDDACANADLLKALTKKYKVKLDYYVKRYYVHETNEFESYLSYASIRKAISEFYGTITGIVIDECINQKEYDYIVNWKNNNKQFLQNDQIKNIIDVIDNIISDGIITTREMFALKNIVKQYIEDVEGSPVTMGTQVLAGILKGITCDNQITLSECVNLKDWLYEHYYLSGHFPFDKIIRTLEQVLEDNIVTKEESEMMILQLDEILNPVEALKGSITDVKGRTVCLSGNFEYGQKAAVAKYISERGGIVESSIKRTTDFLIVGALECLAYSNGTYGTKVKRAIELNQKGCSITILKENDFFNLIK